MVNGIFIGRVVITQDGKKISSKFLQKMKHKSRHIYTGIQSARTQWLSPKARVVGYS